MKILQPPGWVAPKGYSNGIAARGTVVALGGLIGWNAEGKFEHHDFVGQAGQTLRNICTVLAEAGGRPEHIVRMTWYLIDKKQYLEAGRPLGRIYRELMVGADGQVHYPAMAAVQVAALIEDEALVEIEATAVIPD
ncbi:MAG: RidA family protein [Burkholderiaceae bacterium]